MIFDAIYFINCPMCFQLTINKIKGTEGYFSFSKVPDFQRMKNPEYLYWFYAVLSV